jgi:hypothetical protein
MLCSGDEVLIGPQKYGTSHDHFRPTFKGGGRNVEDRMLMAKMLHVKNVES